MVDDGFSARVRELHSVEVDAEQQLGSVWRTVTGT